MNQIELRVKKCYPDVNLPYKAHESDAAFDVEYQNVYHGGVRDIPEVIGPNHTKVLGTGLKFDIPDGYELCVYSRSGLSRKGIIVANAPATIDSGYTGELKIILLNTSQSAYEVQPGDRIAQIKLREVLPTTLVEVNEIREKDRGEKGLGSTGR